MPKIPDKDDTPKNLKPYIFHGVELDWNENETEARGTCPFCFRDDKFSINIETSQGGCFHGSCSEGYNKNSFLKELHKVSEEKTTINDYNELVEEKGLLFADTLLNWRVCKSSITDHWMIPSYTLKNKKLVLSQLYKYFVTDEKKLLLPTPTLGHQLFGLHLYDPDKPEVFLCEGPWDAIALWETLKFTKYLDDGSFGMTSNIDKSLLAETNVLAVPGCKVFFEQWCELFEDKIVNLCYDNDHPKDNQEPAGFNGMKRVASILSSSKTPPSVINFLNWGEDGYDSDLPSGVDVRDLLTQGESTTQQRIDNLVEIQNQLTEVPKQFLSSKKSKSSQNQLSCLECDSYKKLINSWKKALKWTGGLNSALSVMLASSMSTNLIGEQLWFKILGPPASGKTTILEGLALNKKYVLSKDTIRGFYSGWKSSDGKDDSIAAQVKGKTLATKDGDTLLKAPNRDQILSEARGLYDRCGRTHYRNQISHEYEGHRMTWLLCGTNALREIDDSELGTRFLDVVVMDEIDEEFEDDVAWRVANQESNAMMVESNGDPTNRNPESLTKAMQLTGGYLDYLRENVEDLLSKTTISEKELRQCTYYAKFIAFMRARPPKNRNDDVEVTREFSARLVKQLVRLCKCLVVVMNKKSPDEEVMDVVFKITMDTSRGQTLEIVKHLFKEEEGLATNTITVYTGGTDTETAKRLRFLRKIKVVKQIEVVVETRRKGIIQKRKRWGLTDSIRKLYRIVNA